MFFNFSTLLLLIYTLVFLWISITLQTFDFDKGHLINPVSYVLFRASFWAVFSLIPFILFVSLNYCCISRSSRISFKRHLLTFAVIAPILAQLIGKWNGWLESGNGEVEWSAACYDQLDAADPTVLTKMLYCEYKHGIKRSEAERRIKRRRERLEYMERLAEVCYYGLREIEHFEDGSEGVCWMGHGGKEELREGEKRNSEREWRRRAFEECHKRFGVETLLSWKEGTDVMSIKLRTPRIEGTKYTGDFIDIEMPYIDEAIKGF